MTNDYNQLTIHEAIKLLRDRQVSSIELTKACLERIQQVEPQVRAFVTVTGELALEQASMQGIKAWAAANPAKMQAALNENPSYVFFREMPPAAGPTGALGVPLTAGYSIAIDPRHIPLGAPVFLDTTWPLSPKPLQRLVLAQDTGGAIRGAVRADFFWGTGDEAGALAGRMRQRGAMWLLWPRGETPPGA